MELSMSTLYTMSIIDNFKILAYVSLVVSLLAALLVTEFEDLKPALVVGGVSALVCVFIPFSKDLISIMEQCG